MKKRIIRLAVIIGFFIGILCFCNSSHAADLQLWKLDYQVQLLEDGSANVTENWRIYIEDTNTLFKTFEVDTSKYSKITNVKVTEINGGSKKEYTKINEEKYHVDKNCYYALINKKGQFEIAWGVQEEDVTRTYQISYKIVDAIKNYQDCSEFYWQFVSKKSAIPALEVTGTITLPNAVSDKEELRVWAHGPLNGNIQIVDEKTVYFEVQKLAANTMLEARVVTPTAVYPTNQNTNSKAQLASILSQEQKWADEANARREKAQKEKQARELFFKIIRIVLIIMGFILGIFFIIKAIKYHDILKNTLKIEPEQKLDYFRDIPDEEGTPAQASFLYYYKNGYYQSKIADIFSAMMLNLCLKGYLTFELIEGSKNNIQITLKSGNKPISEDEQVVLSVLRHVKKEENTPFTMKDFKKYTEENATTILSKFTRLEDTVKRLQTQKENYDPELEATYQKWTGKGVGYLICGIVSFFFMFFAIIPAFIACIYSFKIAGRYHTLTQKGVNEQEKWKALKRYMEEFSLLKDKEVPDLVLWEKYLVYATAFGISEKVLNQLKVVYPQMMDNAYMSANGYMYLHLMFHMNMSNSLINSLHSSVQSAYMGANYSSGSGSGGGFSGGGGFGGGGGRNGWQIIKNSDYRKIALFFCLTAVIATTAATATTSTSAGMRTGANTNDILFATAGVFGSFFSF